MEANRAWAMIETMARMQASYNREVHVDWPNQGFAFYRAIWVECAELLDHYGWKWWKHQVPDLDQVRLELVDIWHFGLSDLLRTDRLDPGIVTVLDTAMADAPATDPDGNDFRAAVETFAAATLDARGFVVEPFARLLALLPLPLDELFRLYVGKNVLNSFRLANGYRTGTYAKQWGDREDNVHLVEVLADLSCAPDEVPARLLAALDARYRALARPG